MSATKCLELSVPATLASVRAVRGRIADIAAREGAGDDVIDNVRLCVSEAVTNAVVHAYGPDAGTVDVAVELADDELEVVVSDSGTGLTELRRDGDIGYGIRIIERLALRYELSSAPDAGTVVRMVFPLRGPPQRRRLHDRATSLGA